MARLERGSAGTWLHTRAAVAAAPDFPGQPAGAMGTGRIEIGDVTSVDLAERRLTIDAATGERQELSLDRLVLAPGAVTRWFDIPGLREHAFEFKTLPDVIRLIEAAEIAHDPRERAADHRQPGPRAHRLGPRRHPRPPADVEALEPEAAGRRRGRRKAVDGRN